jgi:predicted DNA-binding transcriptional regulator YafY
VLIDDSNEFRIKLKVVVNYELISTILGYGKGVKVIEPETLQRQIVAVTQAVLTVYDD